MIQTAKQLDQYIEAYEAAQQRDGAAELAHFLPPRDHPLYPGVLRELVRVDLEYGWQRGRPRDLEHYRRAFPELFARPEDVQELAFEEYRLRKQAGDAVSAQEYSRRFGVPTADWPDDYGELPGAACAEGYSLVRPARVLQRLGNRPAEEIAAALGDGPEADLFRDLLSSNPVGAADLARSALAPPQPGTEFLGFHLLATLGSGAFGHVYLARQGALADRLVAVKVTASLHREPQTLARLQHPHIVPIYSLHVQAPYQVVCMPYLGHTTLADLLRAVRDHGAMPLSGAFVARLLDEQGTRRGDLPAPAASAVERGRARFTAMNYTDAVLWIMQSVAEALAHAHARGIVHRDIKPANILLTDDGVPMVLDFNLADDLQLRASLPAAFIGGTLPYMAPECLRALAERREHADARSDIYALGVLLFELLTGRHPFALPRTRSPAAVTRLLAERQAGAPHLRPLNFAVSPAAEAIVRRCLEPDPVRRYAQARELAEDLRRQRERLPLRHTLEPSPRERAEKWVKRHPRFISSAGVAIVAAAALLFVLALLVVRSQRVNSRELCLVALNHSSHGRFREALPLLEKASQLDSEDPEVWCALGLCREKLGRDADAAAAYSASIKLTPQLPELYAKRANVALRQKRFEDAVTDLTEAFRLQEAHPVPPGSVAVWYTDRAVAHLAQKEPRKAFDDLNRALDLPGPTRAYFIRAKVHAALGDADGARRDREEGLRREPHDEQSWLVRGWARLPRDPQGALADIEQALKLNPRSMTGLENQAHVLAEHLGRTEDAVAALTRLLKLAPDSAGTLASRGVLYARLGKRTEALADAAAALQRDRSPPTLYQVGGIFALSSKQHAEDRPEGYRLLASALRQGYGWDLLDRDPELEPIRRLPEFQQLLDSLRQERASKNGGPR